MGKSRDEVPEPRGRKVRVPFRRNRSRPRRKGDLTGEVRDAEGNEIEHDRVENVVAKGDLSRQRTVIVRDDDALPKDLRSGVVVTMRGLFADVDDGAAIWPCTVRRVLRTRLIDGRHPVTVGDRVRFRVESEGAGVTREGVIEAVEPRHGELRRVTGKRVHTIAANVDQTIIVSSAAEPFPKPHLIDRYIVASLAGGITPVVCVNKIDLDAGGVGGEIAERYRALGYRALAVSALDGTGMDDLRETLSGKASVVAGQSGVGKSSLLNAVQPDLGLLTAEVSEMNDKGRHTTTTAVLLRLGFGGYVVDTPGIRSFDLSSIPRGEFEAYFVEFLPFVPNCKFADCSHIHEEPCAVKEAVDRGDIHPDRYFSYVHIFTEPGVTP